jgi:Homeodomain-like domain
VNSPHSGQMSQDIVDTTEFGGGACPYLVALGRYIVDAIVLEHRGPTQLARHHGISRSWICRLLQRFQEGGYAALEPRSRRPHSCSHQAAAGVQAEVLRLRAELLAAGHDSGPQTILHHLAGRLDKLPSVSTVWRILNAHATADHTSAPQKTSLCARPAQERRQHIGLGQGASARAELLVLQHLSILPLATLDLIGVPIATGPKIPAFSRWHDVPAGGMGTGQKTTLRARGETVMAIPRCA